MNSPAALGAGDRRKSRPEMFLPGIFSVAAGAPQPSSRVVRLLRSASPLAGDCWTPAAPSASARRSGAPWFHCTFE